MKRIWLFAVLILFMVGTVILGICAKEKALDVAKTSKEYIDNYVVTEIDDSFTYEKHEKVNGDEYYFYYTSDKYDDFTLLVKVSKVNGEYEISNNYSTIESQDNIKKEIEKICNRECIVEITNINELNFLSDIKEMISYNSFNMNIGLLNNNNIDAEIETIKNDFIKNNINCNIYFYHLSKEQYEKYKKTGMAEMNLGFENYTMMIIENGKVTTKKKYE